MKSNYLEELRRRIDDARRLQAETAEYKGWLEKDALDCQINIRISKADLIQFKSLARTRRMKYQTYLREMIRREIRGESGGENGKDPHISATFRKRR